MSKVEKILDPSSDRFVLFPIEYPDIWHLYKKSLGSFWTAEEIDFSKDIKDWEEKLNDKERFFIKNVLAFFAASDGIVNENLALKFYNEVQVPEMRNLYATQIQMEAIHSECVTGETLVLTKKGWYKIGELEGQVVDIYNGYKFCEVLVENTGEKKVYTVEIDNGMSLVCSENHEWVLGGEDKKTKDLAPGDYIVKNWILDHCSFPEKVFLEPRLHAFLSLEGNQDLFNKIRTFLNFHILKTFNQPKYSIPLNFNKETKKAWLQGLLDSDSALLIKNNKGCLLHILCENLPFLKDIQMLLVSIDIYSFIKKTGIVYTLTLPNNSVYNLKHLVTHPKIDKTVVMFSADEFPHKLTITKITPHESPEVCYCFHEKTRGLGLFNGILTKQCYSLMIDTYVKNKEEKMNLFKSLETNPIVAKKAQWALKWINDTQPFAERLIAFCAVEGIFFSGSFCAIFWLKSRGLMPSLCLSNQFISRDESLHCETCIAIYGKLKNRLSTEKIHQIFKEAYEIEREFVTESLPVKLIGMNSDLMKQYIQYVTDYWLIKLGYPKLFNVTNPFGFMEYISMENKTNFFENRVSEYSKVLNKTEEFSIAEEF